MQRQAAVTTTGGGCLIRSTGIGISVTRSYDRSLRICRPLGLVRTWDNLFAQSTQGGASLALGYNPADLQPATAAWGYPPNNETDAAAKSARGRQ